MFCDVYSYVTGSVLCQEKITRCKNDNSSYCKSGIREGKTFEITRWVQWENNLCKHWINLKYSAEIYVVRLGDHFLCMITVNHWRIMM